MGRKLGEIIAITTSLIFFALVFAVGFSEASASEPQVIFVRVSPEKPNSVDGWFWEGATSIKLEVRNKPEQVKKIFYSWDELRFDNKIEYRDAFVPHEGEHWLFAWGEGDNGQLVNPVTRFFMQYRRIPKPTVARIEQVQVSSEKLKYGEGGAVSAGGIGGVGGIGLIGETSEKKGEITAEAASTEKATPTTTPISTLAVAGSPFDFLPTRANLWIVFLIVGIALLVGTRFLFRDRG